MPKTVKKLPKWAIKQAGGINKKAWSLARRGRRGKSGGSSHRGSSHNPGPNSNGKPGWGAMFKMGRTADIFTGPAQGALSRHGLTRAAGESALAAYTANLSRGEFSPESAKNTAGGIGTGLIRQWLRSKLGIYRGLGRGKYLSAVMAANPELLAYTEVDPFENVTGWNDVRSQYDRGYNPTQGNWSTSPATSRGNRLWKSIGVDAVLKVFQKAAEVYLNPMLPKGHNL